MNDQRIIIESLAMDLKRVAVGLQRGSLGMAKRFTAEALQREEELEKQTSNPYLTRLVSGSRKALQTTSSRTPDDALMYSTLFQNYVAFLSKR